MQRGKILTITLNAALDRVLAIDGGIMAPNAIHSARLLSTQPGGKGISVSRALNAFGIPTCAMFFAGGVTGGMITQGLEKEGIECEPVAVRGESRFRLTLATSGASATEVKEKGPVIDEKEGRAFIEQFKRMLPEAAAVAICGSLPEGLTKRFYGELIDIARKAGRISILDASGAELVAGIASKPWAVKPNLVEAETLAGFRIDVADDAVRAVKAVMERIDGTVIVTAGEAGSFFGIGETVYHIGVPKVEAVSRVGVGEAFLAGYLAGWYEGLNPLDAVRLAAGAAASDARHWGSGVVDPAEARSLAELVETNCVFKGELT